VRVVKIRQGGQRAIDDRWPLENDWKDPQTGEIVPSYTMVTMNAETHPLMRLMRKPGRGQGQEGYIGA
jgi:hypothetical protein